MQVDIFVSGKFKLEISLALNFFLVKKAVSVFGTQLTKLDENHFNNELNPDIRCMFCCILASFGIRIS